MKKLLFLLLCFLATACVNSNKGKIFDREDIDAIKVNKTQKDEVIKLIGYPSFQSSFDENRWVYYSYIIRKFLFFKPDFVEQKILLLDFDEKTDTLLNISLYNINSNKYEIFDGKNDTYKQENNVLKDILNNIGTFTPQ
jgi:outer membrane protein assembly factor BamE (lipoprotein component of BamABCDE complex)